jgi:hypothetical protein
MVSRLSIAILAGCLVAAQDLVVAQVPGGDVTLKVPLNLTRLSTDITKVRITCTLYSAALRAYDLQGQETQRISVITEVPVSNGQLVTTSSVVFSKFTLINPAGATAIYDCSLVGTDKTGLSAIFTDSSPFPQFRVTPTPANLKGTFAW